MIHHPANIFTTAAEVAALRNVTYPRDVFSVLMRPRSPAPPMPSQPQVLCQPETVMNAQSRYSDRWQPDALLKGLEGRAQATPRHRTRQVGSGSRPIKTVSGAARYSLNAALGVTSAILLRTQLLALWPVARRRPLPSSPTFSAGAWPL